MTPLQWLAPDMAREGLIKNKAWIPAACEVAVGLFNDPDRRTAMKAAARLHYLAYYSQAQQKKDLDALMARVAEMVGE